MDLPAFSWRPLGVRWMLILLKLSGLAMMFCSFNLVGAAAAFRVEQRPRELRGVIRGLEILQTEVSYGLTRLAPALGRVAEAFDDGALPKVQRFFHRVCQGLQASPEFDRDAATAREAWRGSLEALGRDGCLSARDLTVLRGLGDTLGASGSSDQVRHLQSAIQALRSELETAESDALRAGKVYRSTWAAVGGCMVLLLM